MECTRFWNSHGVVTRQECATNDGTRRLGGGQPSKADRRVAGPYWPPHRIRRRTTWLSEGNSEAWPGCSTASSRGSRRTPGPSFFQTKRALGTRRVEDALSE